MVTVESNQYYTIVHCRICKRILKNPKSRAKGIGPICEKKATIDDYLGTPTFDPTYRTLLDFLKK